MARVINFSDADLNVLRELVRAHRRRLGNTAGRPPDMTGGENDQQGPEMYQAYTPGGGIPKLSTSTTTGTGTAPYDDIVSSAICQVYQLITVSGGSKRLRRVGNLTKRVYNATLVDVPEFTMVPIWRDKFGVWWVAFHPGVTIC